jgi:hypothetical protein
MDAVWHGVRACMTVRVLQVYGQALSSVRRYRDAIAAESQLLALQPPAQADRVAALSSRAHCHIQTGDFAPP